LIRLSGSPFGSRIRGIVSLRSAANLKLLIEEIAGGAYTQGWALERGDIDD